ncbi:MAG: helix-turn-helix domain-containing protein [Actinobacteria bacterium]|nr:helix-turn-helix domain-containing protein [Actinomycetota bacterium]
MYGAFIRALRTSRGLSQGDLAEIVGISQPNLSAYEQGRRTPTLDTLNRIVVACGYELAATDGRRTIYCPLPRAGWFPDDGDPPRSADDPPDESPTITAETPMAERVRALMAALELAEATR